MSGGDFRVRVHMAGRDDAEGVCHLVMWRGITHGDLTVINAADRAVVLGGTIGTTTAASGRSIRGRTS